MSSAMTAFFGAWGEPDATKRNDALCSALASQFTYIDPRSPESITDLAAITAYIGMFTEHAPGATATVVNSSETKGYFRFTVAFRMPNGMEQNGQYFVEFDTDGRASRIIGFAGMGEAE